MSSDARLIQSLEETAQFISSKYKLDDVLNTYSKRGSNNSRRNSLKSSSTTNDSNYIPQIALEKVNNHRLHHHYDNGAEEIEEDDGAPSVHSARSHSSTRQQLSIKAPNQTSIIPPSHSSSSSYNTNNSYQHNQQHEQVLTPTGYLQQHNYSFNQSNLNRPGSAASSNSCISRTSVSQPMYPISNSKLSSPNSVPTYPFSENQIIQEEILSTPRHEQQELFTNELDDASLKLLQEIHDPKSSLNSSRSNSSLGMHQRLLSPSNNNSMSNLSINNQNQKLIDEELNQSINSQNYQLRKDIGNIIPEQEFIEPPNDEEYVVENYEIDETYEIENPNLNRIHLTTSESIINDVFDNNKQTRETIEQVISQLSQVEDELDKQEDELIIKEQFLNPILNNLNNTSNINNSSRLMNQSSINNNQSMNNSMNYNTNNINNSFNNTNTNNNNNTNQLNQLSIPPLNEDVDLKTRLNYFMKYLLHSNEKIKIESIKNIKELIKNQYQSLTDIYYNIVEILNTNIIQLFYNQSKILNRQVIELLILLYKFINNEMIENLIELLKDFKYFEIYDCILTLLFRLGISSIERVFEILNIESEWNNIILTHLVNHPLIIENVIIPILHKECLSFDLDKRQCAIKSIKHLGLISIKCLNTCLNMLINGTCDRVLISQAIRSMGSEGEKSLIKLMESTSNSKVKEAIATVFGELPYLVQSHLTVIANSDIHHFIKSQNPRILYYFSGDEQLPPLLLFDSRELISITRNIIRDGLLDEIQFGNQFTCKSELTLLHAMVCSLKPVIYNDDYGNTTISNFNNQTLLNNTTCIINNNYTLLNSTKNPNTSFNNLSYNYNSNDQNTSFSLLKGYYIKECQRIKQFYSTNISNTTAANNTNAMYGNSTRKMYLHSYFERVEVNTVTMECVNSLMNNFKYTDECVRIASVKSIINLISLTLNNFNQLIEALKLECLTDPSPRVRSLALDAFAKIGKQCSVLNRREKRCILQWILPLIRDSHWQVRMSACNALCEHYLQIINMSNFDKDFYRQVFHYLITALREGTFSRNEICKCLSLLEYDGISQLIYLLRQDSQSMSIQVRISACYGLSLISIDSPYIDRIVETLFMTCNSIEKTPPLVRRAAIKSLGDLAGKSKDKLSYLSPRSLLPFLYSFLKDRQSSVRQMSAQVLAHSGPHGELLLMEALLKDSNPLIRSSAAFGMTFIGPKSIISLILALSNESNPMVKKTIYTSMESFKFDEIISIIESKSKDSILNTVHSILNRINNSRENCYPSDYVLDLFNYIINSNDSISNNNQ